MRLLDLTLPLAVLFGTELGYVAVLAFPAQASALFDALVALIGGLHG